MQKYIRQIETFFQEAIKYIVNQKKKLYKNHESSLWLNIVRLAVCAFLVILAINAGLHFAIYAIALAALVLIIYFIVPMDFLEETVIKKNSSHKTPAKKKRPAKK